MTEEDIRNYIKERHCKTIISVENLNWTYLFHHKMKFAPYESILWAKPEIIKTDNNGNIISIIFLSVTRDFMEEEDFCFEDIFDFEDPIKLEK